MVSQPYQRWLAEAKTGSREGPAPGGDPVPVHSGGLRTRVGESESLRFWGNTPEGVRVEGLRGHAAVSEHFLRHKRSSTSTAGQVQHTFTHTLVPMSRPDVKISVFQETISGAQRPFNQGITYIENTLDL